MKSRCGSDAKTMDYYLAGWVQFDLEMCKGQKNLARPTNRLARPCPRQKT